LDSFSKVTRAEMATPPPTHIPTAQEFLARAKERQRISYAEGFIFRSAREHQPVLPNFDQIKMVCDCFIRNAFERGEDEVFVPIHESRLPAVKDEIARQEIFDHYSSPLYGYKVEISRLNETGWYFTLSAPEATPSVELTGVVKLTADGALVVKTVTTSPPTEFIV
jgi:hypothetical protein